MICQKLQSCGLGPRSSGLLSFGPGVVSSNNLADIAKPFSRPSLSLLLELHSTTGHRLPEQRDPTGL